MAQMTPLHCARRGQGQYRANGEEECRRAPRVSGLTQGIEIGTDWTWLGGVSNKKYAGVSIAVSQFGPKKLYATCSSVA
ncbi:MAG: hypothetical protein ACKVP5_03235 [Aestuariivirga sp.]